MHPRVRVDPRPEQARRALAEAMVELVTADGAREISVSELCKAAGVSRPTFYRHFRTTDEVLARAIRLRLEGIEAELPEKKPEIEQMPATIADFLADLWRERRLYRTALRPDSPYHRTKRVTSAWLENTLRSYAETDGIEMEDNGTLAAFVAGGILAVIARIVEREDLTREGIDQIGRELWLYAGRMVDPRARPDGEAGD